MNYYQSEVDDGYDMVTGANLSHDDKDADRHNGYNENQPFSFVTKQKRATDFP